MDIDWLLLKEYDRNIFSVQNMFGNKEFQGYQRSATGYPITLNKCMSTQSVSLSIEGNTVQDSEPTPDNPVGIAGVGEGTANLYDGNIVEKLIYTTGSNLGQDANGKGADFLAVRSDTWYEVKENTAYTLANNRIPLGVWGFTYNENKVCIARFQVRFTGTSSFVGRFTTVAGAKYFRFLFAEQKGTAIEDCDYLLAEGWLDRSCIYEAGEGYVFKQDIEEYKIPVKIDPANLFTGELIPTSSHYGLNVEKIENGWRFFHEANTLKNIDQKFKCFKLKPYTQYKATAAIKVNSSSIDSPFEFKICDDKFLADHLKTLIRYSTTYESLGVDEIHTIEISCETRDSANIYLEASFTGNNDKDFDVEITNISLIESGIESQTFNLYLPSLIYKVGNYADAITVDLKNKTVQLIQKTAYRNVVSTDDIIRYDTDNFFGMSFFTIPSPPESLSVKGFSDKLPVRISNTGRENEEINTWLSMGTHNTVVLSKSRIGIENTDTDSDKITKFKDYLLTNPIKFLYARKTPETTDISSLQNWKSIPSSLEGTITISTDTTLIPNSIEANYSSSSWEK